MIETRHGFGQIHRVVRQAARILPQIDLFQIEVAGELLDQPGFDIAADEFEASAWHDEFWCDSALTPRLESASGHGNRGREFDAVDFGSQKQGWIAHATLSLSRRTR